MIRQLSNDGLKFRTPRYECSLLAFSEHTHKSTNFDYLVAEESLLTLKEVQVGTHFSGVTVDILGFVKGIPFAVFVTYKGRLLPLELKNPLKTKCGVVELNINAMPGLFKLEEKGQYREVLRRYIEDETEGKIWAYHPREPKLRELALAKRQSWLLQQQTEAKTNASNRRRHQGSIEQQVAGSFSESYKPIEPEIGNYICVMCKSTWIGATRICRKCNTHLYTTQAR
jgi:hypothetical protein